MPRQPSLNYYVARVMNKVFSIMNNLVYFISDHTGITVESLGRSLLSQFKEMQFQYHSKPYVNSQEKVNDLVAKLEGLVQQGNRVIVFSTIVNQALRRALMVKSFQHFDLFSTFLPQLETILEQKASPETGLSHGVVDYHKYMTRIEAIDFTLQHDDGLHHKHYEQADLILIGVSRSGKTPTCLYMAIQYGIRAANYPITEEDLMHDALPNALKKVKDKLFGLLIDVDRLHSIRTERLSNSRYASLEQCKKELVKVEKLYRQENIPFLNTTKLSIEEISTQILLQTGLEKRLY